MRRDNRKNDRIREPRITSDFCPQAYGSVLIEMGNTKVICAASLGSDVPDHASARGTGWLTAEYTLLPYSTPCRTGRDLLRRDGRAVEIQRLIARSLRGSVDLKLLAGRLITVDCDVLQADGGTRSAAITGAYIALKHAVHRMLKEGLIAENPLRLPVAAVSAGYIGGEPYLDLDYDEDSRADVDLNVVMDANLNLIEIQGTGERTTFSKKQLDTMINLAEKGIIELLAVQNKY